MPGLTFRLTPEGPDAISLRNWALKTIHILVLMTYNSRIVRFLDTLPTVRASIYRGRSQPVEASLKAWRSPFMSSLEEGAGSAAASRDSAEVLLNL